MCEECGDRISNLLTAPKQTGPLLFDFSVERAIYNWMAPDSYRKSAELQIGKDKKRHLHVWPWGQQLTEFALGSV